MTAIIVGASKMSQLADNFAGFEFDLTASQYEEVTAIFDTEVREEGLQRFPGRKNNFPGCAAGWTCWTNRTSGCSWVVGHPRASISIRATDTAGARRYAVGRV